MTRFIPAVLSATAVFAFVYAALLVIDMAAILAGHTAGL